jgi:hypothetical protein
MDWCSTNNAVPVIDWLGGNVLRHSVPMINAINCFVLILKSSLPKSPVFEELAGLLLAANCNAFNACTVNTGQGIVTRLLTGPNRLKVLVHAQFSPLTRDHKQNNDHFRW